MNTTSGTGLYLRLLRYVAPYRGAFALGLAGMMVVAATEPVLPAMMKPLLDGIFVEKNEAIMRWMPLFIIALFVVRGIAEYAATFCINWVGNKVVMDLRGAMFARLLELPVPYYDDRASGNLISKLTYDAAQVTTAATSVLTVIFKDSLAMIGLLAWMLWLNWKLTLLALVMTPIIVWVVRAISFRLRASSRDVQRGMGDVTQVLQESIEGHKVVSVPVMQLIAAIALAVMVYIATLQSSAAEITVGGFGSFVAAMLMLNGPLKRITSVNEPLQRGLAAAESIFELLDQDAEADWGTVALARARGEIRFENVSFRYGEAPSPALDAIELAIAPGETLALVGASGSGKTTLVNLVPRFYRPTRGRILLDGHDLAELSLASLRANIALVSQDVVLFNDTVAANIAYGAMNGAARSEVIAAADAAHAMEFIEKMSEGLDTLVGDNGVKLSGGQRQRLAIARALLKNAPVLILDEATSALDSESERHVQAALETLMRGRTTIVVAHRLSTVERADRIVVLDQGRIVEIGTHRELLERGGVYAKLYRIQFADQAHAPTNPPQAVPTSAFADGGSTGAQRTG
ncbi:MAG: Lipid export ATP-binding/permease protein MsbA [Burkholderiales bacterium]|nr:Lipid export ATP-binding/permease protein MsbA [Burkholderiales bacterium]